MSRRAVLAALLILVGCNGAQPAPGRPVIDTHTHVFNARALPVEGFLEAHGVPPFLAWMVRRIVGALQEEPESAGLETKVEDPARPTDDELARLEAELRRDLPLELQDASEAEVSPGEVRRTIVWALLLTCTEDEIAKRLVATYPEVRLFVTSLMDMEFWFPGHPFTPERTYPHMVDATAKLILGHEGRLLPFVAFDPEREVRFRKRPEGSLAIVERAISQQGFGGVKLYPPLGFRPARNAELHGERGTCPFPGTPLKAQQYDEVLEALYAYCEREGVPIAAHCEDPGAESRPGCGKFADPAGWEHVLAAHPRLRLNLMHFGGAEDLATNGRGSWAWRIGALMQRHDHVYADVGAHEIPADPDLAKLFFAELERLFQAFPKAKGRLMVGTDWHMLVRHPEHRRFLERYLAEYQQRFGAVATDRFAAGAAMDYLGLRPGQPNRVRLAAFWKVDKFDWVPAN